MFGANVNGTTFPVDTPFGEGLYDGRVESVFDREDAGGQLLRPIVRPDGYTFLKNDGPGIISLVNHVDRGAGDAAARCNDSAMHIHAVHPLATEFWKQ